MTILEDYLLSNLNDDEEELERVLKISKKTAELNIEVFSIHGVRCATHTMELGVKDTISKKKKRECDDPCIKYVNAIDGVARVVAKLRTAKMKIAMELEELLMPVAFIEIRWSSANTMVNTLQRMHFVTQIIFQCPLRFARDRASEMSRLPRFRANWKGD